ncbi:protein C19orf12 homolog [Actinia tenebrosa]|uniref:Protein C19orf12 homolog n=1 Tax=Actinia tenebrosa TaxID=6105 RepID=A0A6P8I9R5_ACTTE|nr:protein C19orf12 homolog [Actinia tenebrosa]
MPVSPEDVITLFAILTSDSRYRILVSDRRMKGGIIAGIGATVGGVCGGPIGVVVGGVVGGTVAAWTTKRVAIPLEQFLTDMNKEEREHLYQYMRYLVDDCKVKNFVALNAKVASDWELRRRFLDVLFCYLKTEMKLTLIDN